MSAYHADEVLSAAALLGQLLEQHEGLPRHARRFAPADAEPDGRLCRVAVSDAVGFRKRANMFQKAREKLQGESAVYKNPGG